MANTSRSEASIPHDEAAQRLRRSCATNFKNAFRRTTLTWNPEHQFVRDRPCKDGLARAVRSKCAKPRGTIGRRRASFRGPCARSADASTTRRSSRTGRATGASRERSCTVVTGSSLGARRAMGATRSARSVTASESLRHQSRLAKHLHTSMHVFTFAARVCTGPRRSIAVRVLAGEESANCETSLLSS
jgi:hypothetical protein